MLVSGLMMASPPLEERGRSWTISTHDSGVEGRRHGSEVGGWESRAKFCCEKSFLKIFRVQGGFMAGYILMTDRLMQKELPFGFISQSFHHQ